jgi:DmsE family decaheme c-type cytochrome
MPDHSSGRVSSALSSVAVALLMLAGAMFPHDVSAQPAPGKESPEEICKGCHLESFNTYAGSKHSMKMDSRTPANRGGCLACHGDGALEHAKKGGGRGVGGIVNPGSKTLAADAKNGICLTCHQGGKRIHWAGSAHATRDTACTSCHQVHTSHDKVRDKLTQPDVCFTCHKEQRAQINRPSRHPIREGKVVCSDCHNPHGSVGPKQLVRDSVNETCYTCHMEKRGPFVRTHQPVQEDCTICHNPHGTTNPNLLKMRPPFLCQQCHEPTSHRGTIPDATAGAPSTARAVILARGCVNCHTNIHGTNNPANAAGERTFRR